MDALRARRIAFERKRADYLTSSEGIARLEQIHAALQARIDGGEPDVAGLQRRLNTVARALATNRRIAEKKEEQREELKRKGKERKTFDEAREARKNAQENSLHSAMFKVADELGSIFSTLRDANGGDTRFEVKELVFGKPSQAALGIEHYMCVTDTELRIGMSRGLDALRDEVSRNGVDVDRECLAYVLDKEAGSDDTTFQGGLKRDCDDQGRVHPSRWLTAQGRGMRLADFVSHASARTANLDVAHVAALRFYTTAAFNTINNALRDQARYRDKRPHPLPITVALIREALGRLRVVAGESSEANTMVTLYRGMKDMKVENNFLQAGKGGTELAPMSTTSSLKVAMQYSASENPLLLRLRTKNFMVRGPDISFLSAFPGEQEFLFPPLTYLEPVARSTQTLRVDDATFTVIDVEPAQ